MEAFIFDTTEKVLLALTGILFFVQLLYYFCLYNRIYLHNRAVKRNNVHFSQELPPVSVIICAREESENLRRNLIAVLEQDYPQFEVIVINDGDTDESEDYPQYWKRNIHTCITVLFLIPPGISAVKNSLSHWVSKPVNMTGWCSLKPIVCPKAINGYG